MRHLLLLMFSALLWLPGQSQVSVGSGPSVFIQSGTTVFVDGLVLIPSANTPVSNTTLTMTTVSIPGLSGAQSIQRVYNFTNQLPNYQGVAGIIYDDAELAGNNESLLRIAYLTGNTWTTDATGSVNTGTNFVSYTASGQMYNKITATVAGAILPVTFTRFGAELKGQYVQLNWTMGDIEGLTNFDVQYSDDGRNWNTAGIVTGSQHTRDYSYQHNDVNFTSRFYRVMANEVSGVRTYTKLAAIRKGAETASLSIIRKGSGAVLYFNGAIPSMIQLYDVNGRMLMSRNVQQQQVEISGIASGAYIVHYVIDGKKVSKMIQL